MKYIIFFTIFVCVLQFTQGFATYHKSPFLRKTNTKQDKICTSAGTMCKNCEELVDCIKTGDEFIEVDVKHCDAKNKEFCNSPLKDCSTSPNPACAGSGAADFTCHNTGVFPDPLDCRVYHMCVEPKHKLEEKVEEGEIGDGAEGDDKPPEPEEKISHTSLKCDENLGYNPITTYCEIILPNNECPFSNNKGTIPIICEKLGQASAIQDTSIFYVCTQENDNLVPQLFMCSTGGVFNEVKNVCENPDPTATPNYS